MQVKTTPAGSRFGAVAGVDLCPISGGCWGLQIVEDDLWLVVRVVVVGEYDERGDSFREHCGFDFRAGFNCALFYDMKVKVLGWHVGF